MYRLLISILSVVILSVEAWGVKTGIEYVTHRHFAWMAAYAIVVFSTAYVFGADIDRRDDEEDRS